MITVRMAAFTHKFPELSDHKKDLAALVSTLTLQIFLLQKPQVNVMIPRDEHYK